MREQTKSFPQLVGLANSQKKYPFATSTTTTSITITTITTTTITLSTSTTTTNSTTTTTTTNTFGSNRDPVTGTRGETRKTLSGRGTPGGTFQRAH